MNPVAPKSRTRLTSGLRQKSGPHSLELGVRSVEVLRTPDVEPVPMEWMAARPSLSREKVEHEFIEAKRDAPRIGFKRLPRQRVAAHADQVPQHRLLLKANDAIRFDIEDAEIDVDFS